MIEKCLEAARFFGSNIVLFGSVVLTVWLPTGLLSVFAESLLATLQVEGLARLLAPISIGGIIYASMRLRKGESPTLSNAITAGCRAWGRLLAARFCANVIIGLGFIALILPGAVLAVRYTLLEAAVVLEGAGINAARKRSMILTKGIGWQLFGAAVLCGCGILVVSAPVFLIGLLLEPLAMISYLIISLIISIAIAYLVVLFLVFYWEARGAEEAVGEERGALPDRLPVPTYRRLAYLAILLIAVMVSFVPALRSVFFDWNDVPSGAMKPSILEGDRIVVNKAAYDLNVPFTRWSLAKLSDPGRGDIVVFQSPEDGKLLVKRVVGLPGEVIEVRQDRLFVNGVSATYEQLDAAVVEGIDERIRAAFTFSNESIGDSRFPVMIASPYPTMPFGPFRVPESAYFVLGDNRSNSRDSLWFGPVDRAAILGKATSVALSVDPDNAYLPRWSRFLTSLP